MNDLSKTAIDYSGQPIWPLPEPTTIICACGNVFTSRKEPKVCPHCQLRVGTCCDAPACNCEEGCCQ